MSRELAANVYVDGVLYEAGSTPPKDVAEKITNPKAWGESSTPAPADPPADDAPAPKPAKKAAAKKTASSGS